MNDEIHQNLVGVSNHRTLEFAKYLANKNVKVWIRYVVVPGWSDDDDSAHRLGEFTRDMGNVEKIELLPFLHRHRDYVRAGGGTGNAAPAVFAVQRPAWLKVDADYMEKHLMDLQMEKKLVVKEKDGGMIVYPAQFYYMELNTARMLHDLNIRDTVPPEKIRKRLESIVAGEQIELDDHQL